MFLYNLYYDDYLPLHALSFQNARCLSISQFVKVGRFGNRPLAEVDGIEPSLTESKSVAVPFGYTSMCVCRVIITSWIALQHHYAVSSIHLPSSFPRPLSLLCEGNRTAHIIRERPDHLCGWLELNQTSTRQHDHNPYSPHPHKRFIADRKRVVYRPTNG